MPADPSHIAVGWETCNCRDEAAMYKPLDMGVEPTIGGKPLKNGWFISWKTLLKWDDLGGPPLFLETSILWRCKSSLQEVLYTGRCVAMDIGASPGGWSYCLATKLQTQRVIACDPAAYM